MSESGTHDLRMHTCAESCRRVGVAQVMERKWRKTASRGKPRELLGDRVGVDRPTILPAEHKLVVLVARAPRLAFLLDHLDVLEQHINGCRVQRQPAATPP